MPGLQNRHGVRGRTLEFVLTPDRADSLHESFAGAQCGVVDQLPEIVFAHLAIYFHIGVSEMQAGFRVSQATPSWLCSYDCFDS